jgi:hypothetical protein
MNEQQSDFKKIILAWKTEKISPKQLGSLMRQYYVKHLKEDDFGKFVHTPTPVSEETKDLLSTFDGLLPLGQDLDNP